MSEEHPNILWICTDSQRWDTLGCYGNPHVRTPNLDALADAGVLFEHAYAQNPLCQPSRACFLTGRYPVTTKLRQNGQNIPASEVLVTRLLADAGYICGLSGKLHLSACDHRLKLYGKEWYTITTDKRDFFGRTEDVRATERRINDGYTDTEFYWDHAPSGVNPSSAYTRWVQRQGHEVMELRPHEASAYIFEGMPESLHQTTWCCEMAMDFIRAYQHAKHPWLFSVNIFDPHFHFNPPQEYLAPYLEKLEEIPLPNYIADELTHKPYEHHRLAYEGRYKLGEMTDRDHRLCRAAYWAMCNLIDVNIGRLLQTLAETGQRDNTIVIFTSDHGEMLGDHGMYQKGGVLYDPAIHVPLIIRWPGHWDGGRRVDALVELGDLAPTLLEAVGLPRHPGMQTKSLMPLLQGHDPDKQRHSNHREDVYCEYYNANPTKPKVYCTMVRTGEAKIVVYHGQPLGELYDLQADPHETHNLWNDPAYAALKMAMFKRVCDRMAWTCDPLPERIGIF